MARGHGTGSVYFNGTKGSWMGVVTIPTERGEKRQRRTITSKRFCDVLKRFSAECPAPPTRLPAAVRRAQDMAAARDRGTHTTAEWIAHVRQVGRFCEYCGEPISTRIGNWTQDHVVPISRGGSDAIDNLALACSLCNSSKGTMTGDEYVAWRMGA